MVGILKIPKKDIVLLSCLRNNARETLTKMSRKTGIPVSTLYDRLNHNYGSIIKKFTSIIDFKSLGYEITATLMMKVAFSDREKAESFLRVAVNANTVMALSNEYDFMVEAVFRNIAELEEFKKKIHEHASVEKLDVYIISSEIKKEQFLTSRELFGLNIAE